MKHDFFTVGWISWLGIIVWREVFNCCCVFFCLYLFCLLLGEILASRVNVTVYFLPQVKHFAPIENNNGQSLADISFYRLIWSTTIGILLIPPNETFSPQMIINGHQTRDQWLAIILHWTNREYYHINYHVRVYFNPQRESQLRMSFKFLLNLQKQSYTTSALND